MNNDDSSFTQLDRAEISEALKLKWRSLLSELASMNSAIIAFSGGVDSSLLAYAASQVLGEKMMAITIVSLVDPPDIINSAGDFAAQHEINHLFYFHNLLQNPDFRTNPIDRCYHCKTVILKELWNYANEHQYRVVLEGQNADDQTDYRPGRKAVLETGTISPLANNGLMKTEIRLLAKTFGFSNWDQPSSPCLASRIPYGTPITENALDQIDRAEKYLHEKGFPIARVRYHDNLASIEVEPNQINTLLDFREDLVNYFKRIGFLYIALDLQGFRSGSMNEGLSL